MAQTRLTPQEFVTVRQWFLGFGSSERINLAWVDAALDSAPDAPAPANGRPSIRSLPEYHALRQLIESVVGRDPKGVFQDEVIRRLDQLDPARNPSPFSAQYSSDAVLRTARSPVGAAFSDAPVDLALGTARVQRLQRFNTVAANVQQAKYDIPELEDLASGLQGLDRERHGQVCFWLGLAHYYKGNLDKAKEVLGDVDRGSSIYEQARFWLARVAAESSNGVDRNPRSTADAITRCDEFLSAFPGSSYRPQVEEIRAKMVGVRALSDQHVIEFYAKRGGDPFLDNAQRQSFNNAVNYRVQQYAADSRYPDAGTNPIVLFSSAIAYHENHREAEANAVYQKLLALYPTWEGTKQVAERLGPALGRTSPAANTSDPQELYRLAVEHKNHGRQAEAEAFYHQLSRLYPSWEGTRMVARYLGINDMLSAPAPANMAAAPGVTIAQASPTPQTGPQELYGAAMRYLDQRSIKEATTVYNELRERYPTWQGTRAVYDRLAGKVSAFQSN